MYHQQVGYWFRLGFILLLWEGLSALKHNPLYLRCGKFHCLSPVNRKLGTIKASRIFLGSQKSIKNSVRQTEETSWSWLQEVFLRLLSSKGLSHYRHDVHFFKPFLTPGLKGYYSIYVQSQKRQFFIIMLCILNIIQTDWGKIPKYLFV